MYINFVDLTAIDVNSDRKHVPSRLNVGLKDTGNSALKIVGILAA